MTWLKKIWYWLVPGALGVIAALWAVLKPKPRPPIQTVTEEQRDAAHEEIEKEKEEKINAREEKIDKEIDDCLGRFRNS